MSTFKRYDEEFKQSLVNLYQTGKTQSELCKDYGVSASALAKWIKQYSQVRLEDNSVLTAKQIQEWMYTIKVDKTLCVIICFKRHKNERTTYVNI
ncbi:hypothetical protein B7931_10235 [Streptococcus agalactiae]|nr:hypothetical protein B7931_10235 [Streptococcus agalactiae]